MTNEDMIEEFVCPGYVIVLEGGTIETTLKDYNVHDVSAFIEELD